MASGRRYCFIEATVKPGPSSKDAPQVALAREVMKSVAHWVGSLVPRYEMWLIARSFAEDSQSILDIGCGLGPVIENINKHGRYSVGVDIFLPYLIRAKAKGTHTDHVLCDIRSLPFRSKSFDVVLCLDVLEHLEKGEADELIRVAEGIARRKVVISTPTGWHEQHELDDNPYQEHKSAYRPSYFQRLGYTVRGIGLYPKLLAKVGSSRHCSRVYTLGAIALAILVAPIVYVMPGFAGRLVAAKAVSSV